VATDGEDAAGPEKAVTIHVPDDDLGSRKPKKVAEEAPASEEPVVTEAEEPATEAEGEVADGDETPAPVKKKTRRGSRGGRNRKKKPAATANGAEPAVGAEPAAEPEAEPEAAPEPEPESTNGDWEYVPMSEWADEIS